MKDFKELFNYASSENFSEFSKFMKVLTNALSTVALFVTLALAATLVVWAVVVRNRDESELCLVRKKMSGIVIGYSVGVIVTIGSLRLFRDIMKGDVNLEFWLVLGLLLLVFAGIVSLTLMQKKGFNGRKWATFGFGLALSAYVVIMICLVQPATSDYVPNQSWLMYLLSAVLVAGIVLMEIFLGKSSEFDTKSLTYGAICVAASFALSYVKFFSMPQGGSVTFASLLPLALYSYMFGIRKGVAAGVVYGLLQFVQSPQPYHVMQILLDYPIAFGAIGLAGMGKNLRFLQGNVQLEFSFGTTIAVLLRYVAHVLSGYFVFYTWAGDSHPLVYSLIYNTYTLVDLAIVLAVGVLALSSKSLRRIVFATNSD